MARFSTSDRFAGLAAATVFGSAFLLFLVQPIISRMILPWFGGGPAVWTTAMLFFQIALLGGYAWAHFLSQIGSPRRAFWEHVGLLGAAVLTLPIQPADTWKPAAEGQPTLQILFILVSKVGLPFFALAATGPLVGAWFSRVCPSRSAYRLYALSNFGSLLALASFPFLIEPRLATAAQGWAWSAGFVLFSILSSVLAFSNADFGMRSSVHEQSKIRIPRSEIRIQKRLVWLGLPLFASAMLLAATARICQNVAVVPFFWAAPLGLYLVSFIAAFEAEDWYRRRLFAVLLAAFSAWISVNLLSFELTDGANALARAFGSEAHFRFDGLYFSSFFGFLNAFFEKIGFAKRLVISEFAGEATAFLAWLFCLCMVCHGEAARQKPAPERLTDFYLTLAAGGALGGILVGLVCPLVFDFYVEMPLGLFASAAFAAFLIFKSVASETRFGWKKGSLAACAAGLLLLVGRAQLAAFDEKGDSKTLLTRRNFYGVLQVKERGAGGPDCLRELFHGQILHGSQFQDSLRRSRPTNYYGSQTGIGYALRGLRDGDQPMRVGVVGLGAGTLAAYAKKGDRFDFYEINPAVIELARTHFSFLADAPAEVAVHLGDARLTLERQEPQGFDLLALDAFSGDAIPVHLLTREAFGQYVRHLRDPEKGVIAIHITNQHLDLRPVARNLSVHFGMPLVVVVRRQAGIWGEDWSEWAILTRNQAFLNSSAMLEHGERLEFFDPRGGGPRLWTDQTSSLFEIMF